MVTIPVSVGELIDKLSILHVKKLKIVNEDKLSFINKEFELIYNMSSLYLDDDKILNLYRQLIDVNSKLWDVEDELRAIETTKNFDTHFIELARKVYYTNDDRFLLKNQINELTDSEVREQKDYIEYK
jgi:hypothetical protein